jgi:phosphoglycolate phosphatase
MSYKLLLFDFDGTLADSLPWFLQIANQAADRFSFKRVEEHDIDMLRGYSARQVMRHLGVRWWKLPLIGRHVRRLSAAQIDQVALFDGVSAMLHQLARSNLTLAVVTSNTEANVRRVLGPTNAALIRYYECSAPMFGKHTRFRNVMRQSGVAPHEALCIGDELRDLEAARRAGLPFGAVAWGYTKLDAFAPHAPDETFVQVEDIVAAAKPRVII